MPKKKSLEKDIEEKDKKQDIKEIVEESMSKFLGVSIEELNKDISEKLQKRPLLGFEIDTKEGFKKAKKRFKQMFLRKLLRVSYGNISEVAKKAGVDRRSIHRIVRDAGIDVSRIREEMIKPYEIRSKAVGTAIEDVLDSYKKVLHPNKLKEMYAQVSDISKDILDDLPEEKMSLKQAEEEFEKEFIKKSIDENDGSVTKTAKKIGVRYETLLRKMKHLGLKA